MNENQTKLVQMLAATAELMGYELSGVALAYMAKDFQQYDIGLMENALRNVRLNQPRFNQAGIQREIDNLSPDGRPGADEAWAMYPHDENASAVLNSEIADAMGIAHPLIEEGDMIAARMAFKDAYNRIVSQNKLKGIAPQWFPSLGHEPEGRKQALDDAVARGRISPSHAAALLPPPIAGAIVNALPSMKMLSGKADLTDEQKQAARSKLADVRAKVGV
ncbi:hypothetical protein FNL37_1790 [Methylovorus glucosotrophus]|uniref:hypothetical protein n=1 Tax=Methylovorus glucosotrophus TaxID=266009 RepID=UPI0013313C36|nr:hypothetical protein [Methylovorus glucosotrophus]KAF0844346.1 hypothetical protein FNL37_1790 [Methylovorus glucosotrophus]